MRRCRGRRAARAPRMASSRCGRCGRWVRRDPFAASRARSVHAMTTPADAVRAAEMAARHSYSKLIAFLAARTRDVAGAEDALSEALAVALAEWPMSGVPR